MRLNNKGFTLIEILAVVAIIALLGTIATVATTHSLTTSKKTSYTILVSNIVSGAKELFEEVDNNGTIYQFSDDGYRTNVVVSSNGNVSNGNGSSNITVNLQTLIGNGFLTATNAKGAVKKNVRNPITSKDIGYCSITINKNVTNYKVSYTIVNNSTGDNNCPTTEEYEKK